MFAALEYTAELRRAACYASEDLGGTTHEFAHSTIIIIAGEAFK